MTLSRTLSGWIMRLATRRPPPARAEWALAMEREHETMERSGLGWALGCLTTRLAWTLRAQWLYLLLLALVPFLLTWEKDLAFGLFGYGGSRGAFIDYGTLINLLAPLPLAMLFGIYRPGRIGTTLVLGCILAQHVGFTLYASYLMGVPFLFWWGGHATIYMAPPLIGLCASLWIWYLGASLGARLAKRGGSRPASLSPAG